MLVTVEDPTFKLSPNDGVGVEQSNGAEGGSPRSPTVGRRRARALMMGRWCERKSHARITGNWRSRGHRVVPGGKEEEKYEGIVVSKGGFAHFCGYTGDAASGLITQSGGMVTNYQCL